MALKKIKSSFAKLKASSIRTKVLMAVFVVGFAGLGVFQVVNSAAGPATGYGLLSVRVAEAGVNGVLNGNAVPNATIHVVAVPVESSYNCTQTGSPVDWGNSSGSGTGAFTCSTWSGGRLYQVDAGKSGYSSLGPRQVYVYPGSNAMVNLTLKQNDTDGDGIADTYDACPTQGNLGGGLQTNGCPINSTTGNGVASVQVAEMNLAGQFTSNNVTNASVTISPNPVDATYSCAQTSTSNAVGTGNTYSYGIAAFTCKTNSAGKEYVANASKAGYVSKGPYAGVIRIGTTTVLRVVLQQKDTDGDGVADLIDSCPTQKGVAPKGCPASDTTAPTAPSGLRATAKRGGKIILTWNGSTDNVGVTGYNIKLANRGTVASTSSDTKTVTLNGATPGKSYTYTVLAFDAAGNSSAASNRVNVIAK
jgi:hypothetical protein